MSINLLKGPRSILYKNENVLFARVSMINGINKTQHKDKNIILVVCAILINSEGKVIVAQRSTTMPLPLKWEFPGGKINESETPQQALQRELLEELSVRVWAGNMLPIFDYEETNRIVRLLPIMCYLPVAEVIKLTEHAQFLCLKREELTGLDWAAADIPVVAYIQEHWDALLTSFPADKEYPE